MKVLVTNSMDLLINLANIRNSADTYIWQKPLNRKLFVYSYLCSKHIADM